MTACPKCHGAGVREDEDGAECVCRDCCGLGYPDAADMLACLIGIRQADNMARALGEPGLCLATPWRARMAKVIATVADYSTERLAEIRAKADAPAEMIPCSICRGAHPRGVFPHAVE